MTWTFGRKVMLGFVLALVALFGIGFLSYRAIDGLIENNGRVTHSYRVIERLGMTLSLMKDAETGQRGFIITGDPAFLEPYEAGLGALPGTMADIRRLTSDNPRQQARIAELDGLVNSRIKELKRVLDARKADGIDAAQKAIQAGEGKRLMDAIRRVAGEMEQEERELLRVRSDLAEATARDAKTMVGFAAVIALIVVSIAGWTITRSLAQQLGSTVARLRSASAELQAAASQQASGSREQLSATTEVATTIRELLATSKQITESSQRVARIAEETANGARSGTDTVSAARDTMGSMKHQMDVVVGHMLELGKKSQQAGGILDLVNELSEQTNILAINATIEAAGAGESGRRFSVVADEIRKLADRVGGSTKEIRAIIDDIRAAVNTTVMATESGMKAVDAGNARFVDVSTAFQRIAGLVVTSAEAAREIELSTKQQATAVEQVSTAIGSVAQASRENDSSSKQTLQASGELVELSRGLLLLVDATSA